MKLYAFLSVYLDGPIILCITPFFLSFFFLFFFLLKLNIQTLSNLIFLETDPQAIEIIITLHCIVIDVRAKLDLMASSKTRQSLKFKNKKVKKDIKHRVIS